MKLKTVILGGLVVVLPLALMAQAPRGQAPAAVEQNRGAGQGAGGGRGGGGGARGAVGTNPKPTSPVTGNVVAGKTLYYDHGCYGCHGFNGETGRAFVGVWGNLQTEAGFIGFLRARANTAPNTPSTAMPNFPVNSLSDKQARDIYAYIRTFTSHSPEAKDIPTLNTIVNAASRPYKP